MIDRVHSLGGIYTDECIEAVARSGNAEALDLLWGQRKLIDWQRIWKAAAAGGSVRMLDTLKGRFPHNFFWNFGGVISSAAEMARGEAVDWLLQTGFQPVRFDVDAAAFGGDVLILDHLLSAGCEKYHTAMDRAVRGGHLQMVKHMLDIGWPISPTACTTAAEENDFVMLRLLAEHGYPVSVETHVQATRVGNKEMLEFVRARRPHRKRGKSCKKKR
jgi:hypothetical protein